MESGDTVAERLAAPLLVKAAKLESCCSSSASSSTSDPSCTPPPPAQNGHKPLSNGQAELNGHSSQASTSSEPSADSSKCPHWRHFFQLRYPEVMKQLADAAVDRPAAFEELVLDDFAVVLFAEMDQYKIFRAAEEEVRQTERAQEKAQMMAEEENARQVKIKRKGRKSKAELERAEKKRRRREKRERQERRERERLERRAARRKERLERRARGEPEPVRPDRAERQAQRERHEERRRAKEERRRVRREQKLKERRAKQCQPRPLHSPAAPTSLSTAAAHPSNAAPPPPAVLASHTVAASGIGIADLAQHRRSLVVDLPQQLPHHRLFHMRKAPGTPGTPGSASSHAAHSATADELHAMAAAALAQHVAGGVALNGHHSELPQTSAQALALAAASTPCSADESRLSRPGSAARPSSTSGQPVKRPLSTLDPQQQQAAGAGPQSKVMKMEDPMEIYRKQILNQRRNGAPPNPTATPNPLLPQHLQQMNFQLMGMPPVLNGALAGVQAQPDPNFRFAIPQHLVPMGMQQRLPPVSGAALAAGADAQQQLASQLQAGLAQGLNPQQVMQRVQLSQQLQQQAQAAAAVAKPNGQLQQSRPGQPQTTPQPVKQEQQQLFAGHPDFEKTLQQALSAMHAVDPQLLNMNLSALTNGMPLFMNGLTQSNSLNEAQRLLQQRQQQQAAAQRLAQLGQPAPQASPPKSTLGSMSALLQSQLQQQTQSPGQSTPKPLNAEEQRKLSLAAMSAQKPGVPSTSRSQSTCSNSSATPQLSARGTPFQQTARSQPSSTAATSAAAAAPSTAAPTTTSAAAANSAANLVSQLASATALGGKATFANLASENRWNALNIEVASTLKSIFDENRDMDDGSRECQVCAPVPYDKNAEVKQDRKEISKTAFAQPEKPQSGAENQPTTSGQEAKAEVGQTTTASVSAGGSLVAGTSMTSPQNQAQQSRLTNFVPLSASSATSQATNPTSTPAATAQPSSTAMTSSSANLLMRAPTVVAQQQAQQQRANATLNTQQQQLQRIMGMQVGMQQSDALRQQQLLAAVNAQTQQQLDKTAQVRQAGITQMGGRNAAFPFAQQLSAQPLRTPAPAAPARTPQAVGQQQQPSSAATHAAAAAALHPALSAVGLGQQDQLQRQQQLQQQQQALLAANPMLQSMGLGAGSAGVPDQMALLSLLSQQQQLANQQRLEQERQRQQQAAVAAQQQATRQQQLTQQQQQQRPSSGQPGNLQHLSLQQQQLLLAAVGGQQPQPASSAATNPLQGMNLQGLPASTQLMLQQLAQQPNQVNGLPAHLLSALQQQQQAQNGQQQAISQAANPVQNQLHQMQMQVQQQLNQRMSQQHQGLGTGMDSQLLTLLQQQMQGAATGQNAQQGIDVEILRQLQSSVNPTLNQLIQLQQQHQQQQQGQASIAQQQLQQQQQSLLLNQLTGQQGRSVGGQLGLSSSMAAGMNLLEADQLIRQLAGQQPPTNLQTSAQDRQRAVEQHRQFRQQLLAAASTAPDPAQPNGQQQAQQQQAFSAHLAALNGNGQAGLNHLASLQAAQLKAQQQVQQQQQQQQQQQHLLLGGQAPQKKSSTAFDMLNGRPQ